MQQFNNIGILGGTFDPIHYGHIVAAECVRDALQLDRIIFIPAARPPHKTPGEILDSQHRLEMVKLAVKDNPYFVVSELEINRSGLSYTVDTIAVFQQKCPQTKIFFIIGVDALLLINTWKDYERLASMCSFAVVTRPGYQLNRDSEAFRDIPPEVLNKIHLLQVPGLYISSSHIRQRVGRGQTIKYLLPPAIEDYIREHDLYQEEEYSYD
ncbi:MAG: nicotinate-nucleotide adenylyltransferase [Syntrophomonas sp.]|nr:nicotinate-nucleotide adenylyltransferase [Syntrophomonas sp.]